MSVVEQLRQREGIVSSPRTRRCRVPGCEVEASVRVSVVLKVVDRNGKDRYKTASSQFCEVHGEEIFNNAKASLPMRS